MRASSTEAHSHAACAADFSRTTSERPEARRQASLAAGEPAVPRAEPVAEAPTAPFRTEKSGSLGGLATATASGRSAAARMTAQTGNAARSTAAFRRRTATRTAATVCRQETEGLTETTCGSRL